MCLKVDRAGLIWFPHITDYKNTSWSPQTLNFDFYIKPSDGKMYVKDNQGAWRSQINGQVALRFRVNNNNGYNTQKGQKARNCDELGNMLYPQGLAQGTHPGSSSCHDSSGIFGTCKCCHCVNWTTYSPYTPGFFGADGRLTTHFRGKIYIKSNESTKEFEPTMLFDINQLPKKSQKITLHWRNFKPCGSGANISPSNGTSVTTLNITVKKNTTKIDWKDKNNSVLVYSDLVTGLPEKTIDLSGTGQATSPFPGEAPVPVSGFKLIVDGKSSNLVPSASFDVLSLFPDKKSGTKKVILSYDGNSTNGAAQSAEKTIRFFGPPPAPVISSSKTATGSVGSPFSYRITASNSPVSFAATLPANSGLVINATTGFITGTPTTAGILDIPISARNGGGTGSGTLKLTVAPPPQTVTLSPSVPVAGRPLTITYNPTARNLSSASNIYIHFGFNGGNWTTSPGPIMQNDGATRRYVYSVPNNATSIVMCFNNGSNIWDNNSGQNWTFNVSQPTSSTEARCRAIIDKKTSYECSSKDVVGYRYKKLSKKIGITARVLRGRIWTERKWIIEDNPGRKKVYSYLSYYDDNNIPVKIDYPSLYKVAPNASAQYHQDIGYVQAKNICVTYERGFGGCTNCGTLTTPCASCLLEEELLKQQWISIDRSQKLSLDCSACFDEMIQTRNSLITQLNLNSIIEHVSLSNSEIIRLVKIQEPSAINIRINRNFQWTDVGYFTCPQPKNGYCDDGAFFSTSEVSVRKPINGKIETKSVEVLCS